MRRWWKGLRFGAQSLRRAVPAMAGSRTKPVEMLVAAGAGAPPTDGGGLMQAAIQKNNLIEAAKGGSLKGGASGAEALMYMKSSDGDDHKQGADRLFADLHVPAGAAKIHLLARADAVAVVAMDQFVLWRTNCRPESL